MDNKFDKYINIESELEKDSRFSINQKENIDKNLIRKQRQNISIYIFFGFIVFLLIFILKSLVDNLTLIDTVGVNFFNLCNIPKN